MGAQGVAVSDKLDKFTFSVSDDRGESIEKQVFDILVIYEKPALLHKKYSLALVNNNTLLVNQGEFTYITKEHLNIVDFKNNGTPFLYQLKSLPKYGSVKLKNAMLLLNETFSQKEINAGQITFHQNGKGEGWDFFVFSVLNGEGEEIAQNALPIKIVTDNTAPVFVNKNDISLCEGETFLIDKEVLCVTDQEQPPEGLFYEILEQPSKGQLMHMDSGVIRQGGHFTQGDINAKKMQYQHTGGTLDDDHFAFIVSDGEGGATARVVLSIRVHGEGEASPERDEGESGLNENEQEPLLDGEETSLDGILVNCGTVVMLTPLDLSIFQEQTMKHIDFTITVVSLPNHGRLCKTSVPPKPGMAFRRGKAMKEGDVFSKKDLSDGLITYEHDKKSSSSADQFTLKIFDERRKYTHTFEGSISVIADNKAPVVVERRGLHILRGGEATIGEDFLKAVDAEQGPKDLSYCVVVRPEYGSLTLKGHALGNGDVFTQEEINQGSVAYIHAGTSANKDFFMFRVSDGMGGETNKMKFEVNVTEKHFALVHNHPLSIQANKTMNITNNNLGAICTGGEKSQFVYTINKAPEKGVLLVAGEVLKKGMSFTQKQIEGGEVSYCHKPVSDKSVKN